MNIRYKAIGFSLAFTLIPLALLGTAAFLETGRILREKLAVSTSNAVEQVAGRIEYVTADVEDLSLFLVQDAELRDVLLRGSVDDALPDSPLVRVENSLRSLVHSKDYIHSMYIARPGGAVVNPQNTPRQIDDEVLARAGRRPGAAVWFVDVVEDYAFSRTPVLSMVRVMRDVANITRHLGIIRINISLPEIELILDQALESSRATYALLHDEGVVAAVGFRAGNLSSLGTIIAAPRESGVAAVVRLPTTGLTLAYLLPPSAAVPETRRVLTIMVAVMVASLTIYAFVASVFVRRLITPIRRLRDAMTRLEQGDFDTRLVDTRSDEIGLLVASFNTMAERLKDLVQRVYSSELHRREAELLALQSQINPHFLYNTLDAIYWASRLETAPQTGEMIQALSRLFRYSLASGRTTTTVADEVAHLENYLTIQRSVYEENVTFFVRVDPETAGLQTVRLVLQPLVENALHHGIEANGGRGTVEVRVSRSSAGLDFFVADNGPGFDPDRLSRLLDEEAGTGRSIGLRNVNERIRLVFGDEYGLGFANRGAGGAEVRVHQPAIELVYERG